MINERKTRYRLNILNTIKSSTVDIRLWMMQYILIVATHPRPCKVYVSAPHAVIYAWTNVVTVILVYLSPSITTTMMALLTIMCSIYLWQIPCTLTQLPTSRNMRFSCTFCLSLRQLWGSNVSWHTKLNSLDFFYFYLPKLGLMAKHVYVTITALLSKVGSTT